MRKVSVEDIFPFGMVATVSRGANSNSTKPPPTAEVFPTDTKMPLKKVLTFNRKEDFYMDIKVANPERLPGCDSAFIGSYNISGVEPATKFNETEKPKISITFELDRNASSRRRIGAHFARGHRVTPDCFALADGGKLLLTCGHWDTAFKVSRTDTGQVRGGRRRV